MTALQSVLDSSGMVTSIFRKSCGITVWSRNFSICPLRSWFYSVQKIVGLGLSQVWMRPWLFKDDDFHKSNLCTPRQKCSTWPSLHTF